MQCYGAASSTSGSSAFYFNQDTIFNAWDLHDCYESLVVNPKSYTALYNGGPSTTVSVEVTYDFREPYAILELFTSFSCSG